MLRLKSLNLSKSFLRNDCQQANFSLDKPQSKVSGVTPKIISMDTTHSYNFLTVSTVKTKGKVIRYAH